jgi:hypothetical protein
MDFVTNKMKTWYLPRRDYVVKEMQKEELSVSWKKVGDRFEQFKPSSESSVPTEWWIPVYVTRQLLWNRTWAWKKEPVEKGQQPAKEGQQTERTKTDEVETGKDAEDSPKGQAETSAQQEPDSYRGKKVSWFRSRRRKPEDPAP